MATRWQNDSSDVPSGEWEAFALVDELAGSRDAREVLMAASRRFADMFGPWSVYTILMSSSDRQSWRVLALGRPGSGILLSADALTPDTDIDALCAEYGTDVSDALTGGTLPRLQNALSASAPLFLADGESDPLLGEVRKALPPLSESQALLGAGWERPSGRRGFVLLGYERPFEPGEAERLLPRFAPCVRLVAQLSLYPGYSAHISRLEAAARSVRRNIVHDLKTPLTVIKGYVDLLQLPPVADNPEQRREMITAIGEQAEEMMEDLRDLLVPLDDAWQPQPEEVDLCLLLKRAIMGERHTARAAGHVFSLVGTDTPVLAHLDRRKVRRMIENLLSNAVKYSPCPPGERKTVIITLSLETGTAQIAFRDEGIGMTAAQLAFVMAGTGRARDSDNGIEGTGFGLDSVRRVLQAHGGRLEAESQPGKGSTFTAFLPLRAET